MKLASAPLYLDTNIFIYAIEGRSRFTEWTKTLFETMHKNGIMAVTSELTLGECLVGPLKSGNHDLAALYEHTLHASSDLYVEPIDRNILILAASIRADTANTFADAIHLATAKSLGCLQFASNDKIKPVEGIERLSPE